MAHYNLSLAPSFRVLGSAHDRATYLAPSTQVMLPRSEYSALRMIERGTE